MGLIVELRRRNVFRMAGLYLVASWLVTQVAGTLLPAFEAPSWALRTVILVLAIGFVPMLVCAWIFELTPQGLKRDEGVAVANPVAPRTATRLDRSIIVVLLVALGYFAIDKFVVASTARGSDRAQRDRSRAVDVVVPRRRDAHFAEPSAVRQVHCRAAVRESQRRQGERLFRGRRPGPDPDQPREDRRPHGHLAHIDAALCEPSRESEGHRASSASPTSSKAASSVRASMCA